MKSIKIQKKIFLFKNLMYCGSLIPEVFYSLRFCKAKPNAFK